MDHVLQIQPSGRGEGWGSRSGFASENGDACLDKSDLILYRGSGYLFLSS